MLGEKFTQWNPMTERVEYLHIQQSMLDVFTRKWATMSTSKVVGKSSREQDEQQHGEQKIGEQETGQQKIGEQENGEHKVGKQETGQQKIDEQGNDQQKKGEQACVTRWHGTCSV